MSYLPNIPVKSTDPSFAPKVKGGIEYLHKLVVEINSKLDKKEKNLQEMIKEISLANSSININQPINQPLPIAPIVDPNNVQSKLGTTAQVQSAGIPVFSTSPALATIGNDPQLQDTALIRVVDELMVVDEANKTLIPVGGSIGLVLPTSVFDVSGSPTVNGVITATFDNQNANTFFAGPSSGAATTPAFRKPTVADIPIASKGVNITPVSVNANVTTEQSLMVVNIPAGVFNTLNQVMRIAGFGTYDIVGATASLMTFKIRLGGTSGLVLATWTPITPGSTKTNLNWMFELWSVVQTIGATGVLESHGFCNVSQNNATAAGLSNTTSIDSNTGTVGMVDLTASLDLLVTITFNGASTSNVGRQRAMIVEY